MGGSAMEVLTRVPLFADLEADELQLLADSMERRVFRAGETVTAEGSGGDGFFVVESGEAEVAVQGQPQGTIGAGECFGEIALLTGAERAATIVATSDLHCFGLSPTDFQAIVEGNPAIAWKLYESMARWRS